jgi:hypothetical protein
MLFGSGLDFRKQLSQKAVKVSSSARWKKLPRITSWQTVHRKGPKMGIQCPSKRVRLSCGVGGLFQNGRLSRGGRCSINLSMSRNPALCRSIRALRSRTVTLGRFLTFFLTSAFKASLFPLAWISSLERCRALVYHGSYCFSPRLHFFSASFLLSPG